MTDTQDMTLEDCFGTSDPTTIVATYQSVVQQLEDLYAEREAIEKAGVDASSAAATITSLVEQLHALYADGEQFGTAAAA